MTTTESLTAIERSQLERKEQARSAWREGNPTVALSLIRSVLAEPMSPAVAAACYTAEAAFLAETGDFDASANSLEKASAFIDVADLRTQGTFFLQRGRLHRKAGNIDAALTDYTGALTYWQMCGDKNYEGAAYINLAECYLRQPDLEQAHFNIERAFVVLPETSEYLCNAYDTKAKILLADGKAEKAYRLIEKALGSSGGNELWEKEFIETREKIKHRLVEMLAPLAKLEDLDELKLLMVRHALDKSEGSVKRAARILGTSRQLITYTADSNGIGRSKRKKSIIKPSR